MKRRTLLIGAAAISASQLLAARSGAAAAAGSGEVAAASPYTGLPSAEQLLGWNEYMTKLGPRNVGTPAHREYVDFLAAEFAKTGMKVQRDTQNFTGWEASDWSLTVLEGEQKRQIPVAAYYPYSGATTADGVVGELHWLDEHELAGDSDLSGKIAVIEMTTDPGAIAASGIPLLGLKQNPGEDFWASHIIAGINTRPGRMAYGESKMLMQLMGAPALSSLRERGAVAAIVVAKGMSAECLAGNYISFVHPFQDLPTLWLDGATGAALKQGGHSTARLTLTAERQATSSDHVMGILPGTSDEVVIVSSHTDGPNAFEENGSIGILAIAQHLAQLTASERRRTFVIVGVTGHISGTIGSMDHWLEQHPELAARAVLAVNLEHLGATEWVDDAQGYHATGEVQQAVCFVSNHPAAQKTAQSAFEAEQLENVVLVRPLGGKHILGEGAAPNRMGIPTVCYLPGPEYLLSWADGGHLNKLDSARMYNEVHALTHMLHQLNNLSADELRRA